MNAFFITIPHSGEEIATETPWLKGLEEPILMRDLDRYIDRLYQPSIEKLQLPSIRTQWHRYVVDLNRSPKDIDQASVEGAENPIGTHPKGFHWSVTTHKERLIPQPMSQKLHETLCQKYFEPFHREVEAFFASKLSSGAKAVYQLDAHSMPSVGTEMHPDPGEQRAEIVLGDCHGVSCSEDFRELCEQAYKKAGFQVVMNWPYKGGRITEQYGRPQERRHTIQVEMNRKIYMNEETKQILEKESKQVEKQVTQALQYIVGNLNNL